MIRNVAVVGHLHHGKTTLLDMLHEQTHVVTHKMRSNGKQVKFTDTRNDEQERGVSIKTAPLTLVLESVQGKSHPITLLDTPGHVNFSDEVTAAMRLCDGVLLVVDCVEGVMLGTEKTVQQACLEGLPITLVLSKIDRLVTELKIPPADAYHKLNHTIAEVNALIATFAPDRVDALSLSPLKGNVAFASALFGISFSLESFARLYVDVQGMDVDYKAFAGKLWGDQYFVEESRSFKKRGTGDRSFVQFILDPLYKIFSQVISEEREGCDRVLREFGSFLKGSLLQMDIKPLLKEVCSAVFGSATGLTSMLVQRIPSAREGTAARVRRHYSGPLEGDLVDHMLQCDAAGPLVAHVAKLMPRPDGSAFDCLARIISGRVKAGDRVRVLGEGYTPEDEEDSSIQIVSAVELLQARYRVPLTHAVAGSIVLLCGVDATVSKTATLVPEFVGSDCYIFRPLQFLAASVIKIATEPLNPAELPKMVEGLRKISKSYPLAVTKVEESGEHTIFGTGELYLESLMKDLREVYAEIEVKVSDPVSSFCETVVETSSLKCFAETPNRRNKLTMIAEPLDKGLAEDIEAGRVCLDWPKKRVGEFFQTKYEWDLLAARSIWAFGPDSQGPNVLLDDTLPSEVDKGLLGAVRESIVQGFRWGAREGPLCDEPMRNVKLKVLDAQVAPEPAARGGGQMIPTARRVCYSAFLMATPRLMEPVYYVEITAPADSITAIYNVLSRRRGHVTADVPKPGTPIFIVKAFLPVIESFGFETDLRYHTMGQAFCSQVFDHWQVVPGDPLDRSIVLRPLESAPVHALAREFMVKTRRRKGMSEDVSIAKFFDDDMLASLSSLMAQ